MKPKRIIKQITIVNPDGTKSIVQMVGGVAAKVELVAHTPSPTHVMAMVTNGYNGIYEPFVLPEEVPELSMDIKNTKLRTPMEMVGLTWLIEGVTRAWTHQAVRYRVGASYVQESMRFWGQREVYEVLAPPNVLKSTVTTLQYWDGILEGIRAYIELRRQGIPDQDCRGSLPTNILTKMFMHTSLSTLRNIFESRWCCQAQTTEWMPIMIQMKKQLVDLGLDSFLEAPIDRGEPCGFNASFDRPCSWKQRSLEEIEEIFDELE